MVWFRSQTHEQERENRLPFSTLTILVLNQSFFYFFLEIIYLPLHLLILKAVLYIGNSLVVQWLGLNTFTAVVLV